MLAKFADGVDPSKNKKLHEADRITLEEAFAFKILLSDNETPLADDARRAMQALARQAESITHAYRKIPDIHPAWQTHLVRQ